MKLKYNKATLSTLEEVFAEFDYMIRYEKGNFQSGYCILNSKNIIVVNKFFPTEGRIRCLIDILKELSPNLSIESLTEENHQKIFKNLEKIQMD